MWTFTVLFWLLVLALLARWVFATPQHALPEQTRRTEAELARLREELDLLTAQVDRLQEEQSFMVRLLSEGRPRPDALRPGPDEVTLPGQRAERRDPVAEGEPENRTT